VLQLPAVGLTEPPVPDEQSLQLQLAALQLAANVETAALQLPAVQPAWV
jgi:hypothetical protein